MSNMSSLLALVLLPAAAPADDAAAARAAVDYENDRQLTAFEAFGKEDLHVDSSSTETR